MASDSEKINPEKGRTALSDKRLAEHFIREIEDAKEWRDATGHAQDWPLFLDRFRCKVEEGEDGKDTLKRNLSYSLFQAQQPDLLPRRIRVKVTALRHGFEGHAYVLAEVLNTLFRITKFRKQLRRMLPDLWICGSMFGKVLFDSEFGLSTARLLSGWDPKTWPGFSRERRRLEYHSLMKVGMPLVLRVAPNRMFLPHGCGDINAAQWAAELILRPLEDIMADKRYKGVSKRDALTTRDVKGKDRKLLQHEPLKREALYVPFYEVHDKQTGLVLAVTAETQKLIRVDDDVLGQLFGGLSYVMESFNIFGDLCWGVPDAHIIRTSEVELDETLAGMQVERKTKLGRLLFDKNKISQEDIDEFVTEITNVVVSCDGDPREALADYVGQLSPVLLQMRVAAEDNARELTGLGRQQQGQSEPGRRSALEIGVIHSHNQGRVGLRKSFLEDFVVEVCEMFQTVITTFWDQEQATSLVGPDGLVYWVSFRGADLAQKFIFSVSFENDSQDEVERRKRESYELMQVFGPLAMQNKILMRKILANFDWINVDEVVPLERAEQTRGPMPVDEYSKLLPTLAPPSLEAPSAAV